MKVAIIPARGGSKRIPRKNIKSFCGKPIIAWSIDAAIQSGLFDEIIVSTDDEEIATIARAYGAKVPFMRPAALADDYTGTHAVVKHALQELEHQGSVINHVCCMYATAPFIQVEDILQGYKNITQYEEIHYSFPVCEFPYPIQRALKHTNKNRIEMFQQQYCFSRSQDLEPAFYDVGQFYWGKKDAYINELPLFGRHSMTIVIPRKRAIDLDTPEDWELAVLMSRYLFSNNRLSCVS